MSALKVIEYSSSDELYVRTLALREAVLRRPLGLKFSENMAELERDYRHFVLVAERQATPLGCLMVVRQEGGCFQIRQMAVADAFQRRGHGSHLMLGVEQVLIREGFKGRLFLHARDVAIGFYARLGYVEVGEPFIEVGISHTKMEKTIL